MKKAVSLVLMIIIVLSICGCSKASGLTIDALQQKFVKMDDGLAFEKTKTESGYSFHYKKDNGITAVEYSGEADAKENVTAIKIVNSDVDTGILKDKSKLSKTTTKSAGAMTMNDLRVVECVLQVQYLREAFGANDGDTSVQSFLDFFTQDNSTMTVGDWTIRMDIEGEDTVVISASYSAK